MHAVSVTSSGAAAFGEGFALGSHMFHAWRHRLYGDDFVLELRWGVAYTMPSSELLAK
jgi:hypothetical protein